MAVPPKLLEHVSGRGLYKNSLTNSPVLKKSNSGFPNETHRWEQI